MSDDELERDVEERLYAQIHHQEDDTIVLQPEETNSGQLSISVDPVKRRFLSNRYWSGATPPPPRPQTSTFRRPQTRPSDKATATVLGIAEKMTEEVGSSLPATNRPVEVFGFKAYSSVLQSIGTAKAAAPISKNFRKPDNVAKKGKVDNRPDHLLSKLERVQKYLAKAQKAEIAKKKNKKQQQQQQQQPQQKKAKPLTTISLDSSSAESEDDDVIEIPVPPPPLVCLDDSSDDSMQAPASNVPLPKSATVVRTSRCSSPSSSIISDDFIAPLDRNCLSDSMDSVNMTEEDLRAAGKSRSSVAQALNKKRGVVTRSTVAAELSTAPSSSTAPSQSLANCNNSKTARPRIPLLYKNLIASQKDVTIANYHEDAANADDVVLVVAADENITGKVIDNVPSSSSSFAVVSGGGTVCSSDPKKSRRRNVSTGDSVYTKGSALGSAKRQRTAKPVPESSDSESEIAPPAAVPVDKISSKTATPKPSSSSSNKPKTTKRKSRPEDDPAKSSSSESEAVGLPYIRSGEAVSHAQTGETKKRQRRNTLTVTPQSDNVFISMISTIAQGGEVSDSDSVEMLPSTIEEVTICSSEDTAAPEASETRRSRKTSAISFNEFPHEAILKLVPIERREEWAICDADRMGPQPMPRVKCTNCYEMGHVRSRCKRPYKPPTCYMCGETGHREPRCPNAVCLMCGSPTQTYHIRCHKCNHWTKHRCPNCQVMGHPLWMCPDKWRRYHSTTRNTRQLTRLDGTLVRQFKCCSVCGLRGHTAFHCRRANVLLEFPVGPVSIMRYDPIYPRTDHNSDLEMWTNREADRCEEKRKRRQDEAVEKRRKDRSSKSTSKEHEKDKSPTHVEVEQQVNQVEKTPTSVVVEKPSESTLKVPSAENASAETKQAPNSVKAFKITVDVQSDERMVTSTTVGEKGSGGSGPIVARKMSPNSDSNYSFSEFFDKDKQAAMAAGQPTESEVVEEAAITEEVTAQEDFISINTPTQSSPPRPSHSLLVNEDTNSSHVSSSHQTTAPLQRLPESTPLAPPVTTIAKDEESEARIFLSKDHSKVLINEAGSKFLQELSEKHTIRVRLEWQAIGNLLTLTGSQANQNAFHGALTKFLMREDDRMGVDSMIGNSQLPKRRDALIQVIQASFSLLQTYLGNVWDMYRKVMEFERHGGGKRGVQKRDKMRRTMNMILFGQAGLRDGARRMDELKRNLTELLGYQGTSNYVENKFRDEIENNFRYIFSAVRHDNYPDLLQRYAVWRKSKRCIDNTKKATTTGSTNVPGGSVQQPR